jgi:hypothetical protein
MFSDRLQVPKGYLCGLPAKGYLRGAVLPGADGQPHGPAFSHYGFCIQQRYGLLIGHGLF